MKPFVLSVAAKLQSRRTRALKVLRLCDFVATLSTNGNFFRSPQTSNFTLFPSPFTLHPSPFTLHSSLGVFGNLSAFPLC